MANQWIIGGTHPYLVWRDLQALKERYWKQSAVFITPSEVTFLTDSSQVILVEDPKGVDFPEILSGELDVLIHWQGKEPTDQPWLKKIPKNHQRWYEAPPVWEEQGAAEYFTAMESSKYGRPDLAKDLAHQIVKAVGTDLGTLSWEVKKAHLRSPSKEPLTAQDFKQTLAPMERGSIRDLFEILGGTQVYTLLKLLKRVGGTKPTSSDTMKAVYLLYPTVLDLYCAAVGQERGYVAEGIAETLGMHPYRYKSSIADQAHQIGSQRLLELLGCLAQAEQAVLNGARDSWGVLTVSLVKWMKK